MSFRSVLAIAVLVALARCAPNATGCRYTGEQVLVELGPPRSTTTFQSHVLVASLLILHHDEDGVYITLAYGSKLPAPKPRQYYVQKAHETGHWRKWKGSRTSAMLFMTSRKGTKVSPQLRADACYVQDYETVLDENLYILRDYQRIFGMNESQYDHLRAYMRYWEVIRKCCGVQSSADHLRVLHATVGGHDAETKHLEHAFEDLDYPDCEIYNLTQVEENFEATQVRRWMSDLGKRGQYKNGMDFYYTGPGYCRRQNTAIAAKHLGINNNKQGKLQFYRPGNLK